MQTTVQYLRMAGQALRYPFMINGWHLSTRPLALTHSVTIACNSLCKTCGIGAHYRANPELAWRDLTCDEIDKIYRSIGPLYFYNISGGEPFLRDDLDKIVECALLRLKPKVIHIPTNALLPQKIKKKTQQILKKIERHQSKAILTIKPSIDGIGATHDQIRGVEGSFAKLTETIQILQDISRSHDCFFLELGTVVSRFNMEDLDAIQKFVHSLNIQSYRNEIAEIRAEFFNENDDITPDAENYRLLMKHFKAGIKNNIQGKKIWTKKTEALRLIYYDLVPRIMEEKKRVFPCYAGLSSIHLNHDGELWPCCILGYSRPLGHFRSPSINYDYQRLMKFAQALSTLEFIRRGNCFCTMANQTYANILFHIPSLWKTFFCFLGLVLNNGEKKHMESS
ncbi:MAG: radical SAM protein [Candidatus Aminicenantes bacterium]|nr:radical SAM protein [Candidatus Aminicenantes bacterium]